MYKAAKKKKKKKKQETKKCKRKYASLATIFGRKKKALENGMKRWERTE
jgi:hypothetical protein